MPASLHPLFSVRLIKRPKQTPHVQYPREMLPELTKLVSVDSRHYENTYAVINTRSKAAVETKQKIYSYFRSSSRLKTKCYCR